MGGTKTATETSCGEESTFLESESGAMAAGAGLYSLGTTTTAGCWSRTTQQFALAAVPLSAAAAQQLCSDLWFICRQVPTGMSIAPVSAMAKLVRWKIPIFMSRVYHPYEFCW
jgi:hypothetical protein